MQSSKYERSGQLSIAPNLPLALGVEGIIKLEGAISKAAFKKEGRAEANDVMLVSMPESDDPNNLYTLTVPTIMKNELEKNFPKAEYVGKVFLYARFPKGQGGKASPIRLELLKLKK